MALMLHSHLTGHQVVGSLQLQHSFAFSGAQVHHWMPSSFRHPPLRGIQGPPLGTCHIDTCHVASGHHHEHRPRTLHAACHISLPNAPRVLPSRLCLGGIHKLDLHVVGALHAYHVSHVLDGGDPLVIPTQLHFSLWWLEAPARALGSHAVGAWKQLRDAEANLLAA